LSRDLGGLNVAPTQETKTNLAAFSVATQRSWRYSEGAWESHTEWHRCVSFGKLADFAATLKKGAHVQVEGFAVANTKKTGMKYEVFEHRLASLLKLDRAERRREDESDGTGN
jgi:single-strand DNA-binding protein